MDVQITSKGDATLNISAGEVYFLRKYLRQAAHNASLAGGTHSRDAVHANALLDALPETFVADGMHVFQA